MPRLPMVASFIETLVNQIGTGGNRGLFAFLRLHLEQPQSGNEKQRHEKDGQDSGGEHAPDGACPYCVLTARTSTT
jgi:hypothetical protein